MRAPGEVEMAGSAPGEPPENWDKHYKPTPHSVRAQLRVSSCTRVRMISVREFTGDASFVM